MSASTTSNTASERSDDDLLRLTAEGDRAAFALFYDRSAARVLGLIRRGGCDRTQSEEVTEEVFLELWRTATRFDPRRGDALTWALAVAHRRAVDRVRAISPTRSRDVTVGIRNIEDPRGEGSDIGETRFDYQQVSQGLGRLSTVQREAIDLTYFRRLSSTETAQHVGVPAGILNKRLRDGLRVLRRELDQ